VAGQIVGAGFPVVIDATFLKRQQRDEFRNLADRLHVPFMVLDFLAREETLRWRVEERGRKVRDASEADNEVLEHQLRSSEKLTPDELRVTLSIDTEDPKSFEQLSRRIQERITCG
jgi:predicted kinase